MNHQGSLMVGTAGISTIESTSVTSVLNFYFFENILYTTITTYDILQPCSKNPHGLPPKKPLSACDALPGHSSCGEKKESDLYGSAWAKARDRLSSTTKMTLTAGFHNEPGLKHLAMTATS